MDAATASAELERRKWRLLPERLPNLKGKWLTLYMIVWAIVLPLALIGAARGTYIILSTPTMWSPYGFVAFEDSNGLHVETVYLPAVRAAGLGPGDYVVAIDGWQAPRTAARAAARQRLVKPEGSHTNFTIRKPSGQLSEIQLVRSRANEEERFRDAGMSFTVARSLAFVGSLLLPALFIPAAILLFVRGRREAVPACLSLAFLLVASIYTGGDLLGVPIWLVDVVGTAATVLLFAALFAFPSGRFEPRWTAIPFLILFPAIFIEMQLFDAVFSLLAIAALISRYRMVGPGAQRLQLRWAFLGLGAGLLLNVILIGADAATAAFGAEDPRWFTWQYALVAPLGTLAVCVMALGLIVSILRYRLYDADTVIGRSVAYGVLTLGFVALFAASQKIIELLGEEYLGRNMGALAGGIGAALAAVAIAPMHARAQRWAERRFQKALYRLRHGLPPLVGDLRETSGVEQIAGATLDSLVEGVRASRAALIAGHELIDAREIPANEVEKWRSGWTPVVRDGIDCDEADPVFPVRVPLEAEGHGRVGWLLLGPRPDGSLFGKAERAAIEEVAEPVARAVQVALTRQEREAGYEQRFAALEEAVGQLQAAAKPSAA
jgi:hypothetical protein